jgi:hypothetical protein
LKASLSTGYSEYGKVLSNQKDLYSLVSMCFLVHRIFFIPSAEDLTLIYPDILVSVLCQLAAFRFDS